MKWSETLIFAQPLREVALLAAAPGADWEALLNAREQAAYQRGQQETERSISEQLARERAEVAESQRAILQSLGEALTQVVRESETALLNLALEAARRVVANIPIDVQMVDAVVREALQQTQDTAEILVQLHPEDLSLLRKNQAEILNGLPDKGPLRFIGSSEVTRGGCLVQTRFGVIDARREVKLQQLAETISA